MPCRSSATGEINPSFAVGRSDSSHLPPAPRGVHKLRQRDPFILPGSGG